MHFRYGTGNYMKRLETIAIGQKRPDVVTFQKQGVNYKNG